MPRDLRIEWDSRKSEANRRKHRIDFHFARLVFLDPLRKTDIEGDDHGEIRWRTVGEINGKLYVVSHTIHEEEEEEVCRIITARRPTSGERKTFEETA